MSISIPGSPRSVSSHGSATHMKGIGTFGSICLVVNNITGPGMVQISTLFQSSGWLLPTLFLVFMTVFSVIIALYLAETMCVYPGNHDFVRRIEMEDLITHTLPKWSHTAIFLVLIANLQAVNIASIVVSSQTMDNLIIMLFGKTCGLGLFEFPCVTNAGSSDSPFGETSVMSAGFLLVLAMTVPLGLLNLDDNIGVQMGSFCIFMTSIVVFAFQFSHTGLEAHRVPLLGSDYSSLMSTVVFNFGFLVTVPSWVNEKKQDVSVTNVLLISAGIAMTVFLFIGVMGGMGTEANGQDFLGMLSHGGGSGDDNVLPIAHVFAFIFPLVTLVSGIPITCIIVRYNMERLNLFSKFGNLVVSLALPWSTSLLFYSGDRLGDFISWSSALFFVGVNFVLPMLFYELTPDVPFSETLTIHHEDVTNEFAGTLLKALPSDRSSLPSLLLVIAVALFGTTLILQMGFSGLTAFVVTYVTMHSAVVALRNRRPLKHDSDVDKQDYGTL